MNIYWIHKCLLYACVNLVKYDPYKKETRKLRVIYKKEFRAWMIQLLLISSFSVLKNGPWGLSNMHFPGPPLILVLYLWSSSGICTFTDTLGGYDAGGTRDTERIILNLCFMLTTMRSSWNYYLGPDIWAKVVSKDCSAASSVRAIPCE